PFEIKQEILPWTGILAGVSTGKYDVAITAAIITKERKQSLDFTSPIADATHYYVKRKDDKSISSIKDLSGKTVGVQAGSALLARLPELGAMLEKDGGKLGKIVEYTSYPEAYQDLALGRVDYVVNTIINLKTLVAEKPVFEVGQAVSGKSFPAWAVAKDNKELLAFLNEFIAKEKASGRFSELQKKWFGEAFPDLPVAFEPEF
ncbi:MAG TPA: transporter substrate-binding domain-containing protein, partial [Bradyrhizobium sp.]|nr:transporter substrate-binding domain-containing protein [Bradyrhizobium sp.]